MKKVLLVVALLTAAFVVVVRAAQDTDISNREARDPKKLEAWLEANAQDAETRMALDEAVGVTNVVITAAAPVTNVTGLAAFATNVVLTLQYGDVVYGDVTNSLLTNVTVTVQSAAAPAVQSGAAPTLTIQR